MGNRIIRPGAYQIINEINGHSYVGSSKDINNRWANWRRDFKKPRRNRCILWDAVQKYGIEHFTFIILERCEPVKEVLLAVEQHYIDTLKPEYNILPTAYSRLGSKHSLETIAKMAKAIKAYYDEHPEAGAKITERLLGHLTSDETKAKIAAAHTGQTRSEETKENMSVASQHRWEDQAQRNAMSDIKTKWHAENPEGAEKHSEDLARYWSNSANREAQSERRKQHFINNPDAGEEHGQRMQAYYDQHPEARDYQRELKRQYHEANPQAAEEARQRAVRQFSNPAARKAASEKSIAFNNSPEQVVKRERRDALIEEKLLQKMSVRKVIAETGFSVNVITPIRQRLVAQGLMSQTKGRAPQKRKSA